VSRGVPPALLAIWTHDHMTAARGATLLLWALIPPLGLMVHLVEIHPYYFVVAMPAVYILEGCGVLAVARLLARQSRRLRASALAAGATGLLVASQLALAVPFFAVLPEFWQGADYGLPLQTTLKLTATARSLAAGTLVVVGGYDHDIDETLYSTLSRAFPGARYADDRGILEYAASGPALLYLTTDDRSWEATMLRDRFAGSQVAQVQLPGEGRTFRFFRPSASAMLAWVRQVAPALKTPAPFGTAAELTGAAVQGAVPGTSAHVVLDWRLLQEPAQPLLMRLELTGNDGYVWTSTDAVSYPAGYWHSGDAGRLAFLDNIDLPLPAYLPPGGYDVRVRLRGIADGKQLGAPVAAGSLTISPAAAIAAAGAAPGSAPALPHATAAALAPGLRLVGWNVDRTSVQQNDVLGATLFWRVDGPVAQVPPLHLRAPNGATVATVDTSELAAALPPARWPPGALLADRHLLHIDGRATTGPATLTLVTSSGQAVALTPITVVALPRTTGLPAMPFPTDIRFGGVIRLAGYALDPAAAPRGTAVRVTLYWQASGLRSADGRVFLHLVDAKGNTVAQADGPPGSTAEPTSTWEPGQVVTDVHTLALPATLPAGTYHLQVGLYALQTGDRLPAAGPGLAPGADHVELAQDLLVRP